MERNISAIAMAFRRWLENGSIVNVQTLTPKSSKRLRLTVCRCGHSLNRILVHMLSRDNLAEIDYFYYHFVSLNGFE